MAMRIEGAGAPGKKVAGKPPKKPAAASPGNPFGKPAPRTTGVPFKPPAQTDVFGRPAPRTTGVPFKAPAAPQSGGLNKGGGGVGTNAYGNVGAYGAASAGGGGGGGMSNEQWLAQDADYLDQQAALKREYENLVAQLARQQGDYELDVNNTYRNLGWSKDGGWNQNDKMTAYGQSFQNQLGDFASRGMLDSSLYSRSLNDLNRGFEQQRTDVDAGLQRFLEGISGDRTRGKAAYDEGLVAAQRQALQRMAMGLGI